MEEQSTENLLWPFPRGYTCSLAYESSSSTKPLQHSVWWMFVTSYDKSMLASQNERNLPLGWLINEEDLIMDQCHYHLLKIYFDIKLYVSSVLSGNFCKTLKTYYRRIYFLKFHKRFDNIFIKLCFLVYSYVKNSCYSKNITRLLCFSGLQ